MSASKIVHEDIDARQRFLTAVSKNDAAEAKRVLASLIDSTVLKQQSTEADVLALYSEATRFSFRAVCVAPPFVSLLKKQAKTNGPRICTVIGFPNGTQTAATKVFETKEAVASGADEVDFVQNLGLVFDKKWDALESEYSQIVSAAQGKLVKVIFETALLSVEQIAKCTEIAAKAGVHVVKTSTGFASRGASLQDITTMAKTIGAQTTAVGIKASGGVRSFADAVKMVEAGATRLGTSQGKALIADGEMTDNY